jgi:hypothetical protein
MLFATIALIGGFLLGVGTDRLVAYVGMYNEAREEKVKW